ncbi:MAG: histidine kinase dimerization/phospho-acceptor domain-containing protein [Archangium sp.]|nr:histidine kinase dimerization/phospho-acceptor domain-containing protein [Archangium sp.]
MIIALQVRPIEVGNLPFPPAGTSRTWTLLDFSRGAAAVVTAIGALGLVGWAFDIPFLRGRDLTFVTLKANTAAGLLLAGLALAFDTARHPSLRRLSGALAATLAVLGLATLGEFLTGNSLGIDRLLSDSSTDSTPNRMGPNTALAFLFCGAGLVGGSWARASGFAEAALLAACSVCLVAVCGYAYGVPSFYGPSGQLPMPLVVAAGLLLLCCGALAAHPARGLMALLTGPGAGSRLARRFLPVAVLLPIGEGWLKLEGQRAGLFSAEFGVALFAVATVVLLSATALWNLGSLNTSERRTLAAKANVETVNRELEAFAYSVSHDLRAPLRGIDGFSQALLEDSGPSLDAQGKAHLARIRAGAQRMGHLIDDLLKLSMLSRSTLKHARVPVSAVVNEIVAELRLREPGRQVEIVVAPGLTADGDPELIRIALENLIGNAWKFTSRRALARIEVGQAAPENGAPVFFVRDNGAGFDMRYAPKLFGAFQRLHAMADFPGTGIGLATVQRIMHRHGGRAWAEGVVDEGATISFTLGKGRD